MSPSLIEHEAIAAELIMLLRMYLRANPIGKMLTSGAGNESPNGDMLPLSVAFVKDVLR